ncbi:F0F1 ATP synthase subunit A [Spiroplasma endosymbiont of Othius punctulatus]|uniref:F0F1 ATP synthase subunit A n=1 Tax=Spiroplasma endosymbiont of Othius punctulatus TaxID=3066289 RepID=UPI0030CFF13D
MFFSESPTLWGITPQLTSIVLTTIIICIICIVYNVKVRNYNVKQPMPGFLVLIETFVGSVENMVVSSMGKKYAKLTPYAMYIIMYIFTGSMLSLLGFEPHTTSLTVTLAMGFVTFIGIYYFGLKVQKFRFFRKYLNPMELIGQFVPLISISFRLFGNILGGSIILGMAYGMMIGLQGSLLLGYNPAGDIWNPESTLKPEYLLAGLNVGAVLITPFIHLYLDFFEGGLQSFVFITLTLTYWGESVHVEEHEDVEDKGLTHMQEQRK